MRYFALVSFALVFFALIFFVVALLTKVQALKKQITELKSSTGDAPSSLSRGRGISLSADF